MKKLFASLLAAAMLLSCSACSSGSSDDKLTIATSPDFPPFESLASDGSVEGIEIDIMKLVAEKLDKELVIEQIDFDSVLPGVQAGKYDVGVSGISVTPEREKNTLFTDPYCLAAQAIVVVKDSPIQGKADLTGKKIAVQTGTTAESFCMENGYDVSSFVANNDAQSALLSGKVDAWVIDDLTAADMVKAYDAENPGQLIILDEALTTEPYAFAFKLGNDELVDDVNEVIAELLADGTIASIFEAHDAPYTAPDEQ
ncbi:MAG: amino acid ABC transporter substrate-binding protein [Oscillospiraceae bacterium]|nr:amino acid ABC transporter substrate-binding protein [Oscillospiraceae bacterium]